MCAEMTQMQRNARSMPPLCSGVVTSGKLQVARPVSVIIYKLKIKSRRVQNRPNDSLNSQIAQRWIRPEWF